MAAEGIRRTIPKLEFYYAASIGVMGRTWSLDFDKFLDKASDVVLDDYPASQTEISIEPWEWH